MPSLTLDSDDRPHIAFFLRYFGEPNPLYYGYYDGVTWIVQLVSDGSYVYGSYPAIALDGSGQPRISYLNENEELQYASIEQSGWQIETVDRTGYVGGDASSAIDSSGQPHVAFKDFGAAFCPPQAVKYASYDGTAWQIETVMAGAGIGSYISLALDAADQPHISYYDSANGDLKYAHYNGVSWQIETVDSAGEYVGQYSSIAVDAADRPHIAYRAYSYSSPGNPLDGQGQAIDMDLRYAHFDGAAWQIESVDTAGYAGYYTSLALDDQDHPHIAYYTDYPVYHIKYAYHNGTAWQIQVVSGGYGFTTLALDAAGRPHLTYANGGIHYAYHDGASWNLETVVSGSYYPHSLVLDAADRPHIAYTQWLGPEYQQAFGYAYHDGISWQLETIESYGTCGSDSTVRLGVDAQPQMAYFDGTYGTDAGISWLNGDLKYAHRVNCIPPQDLQFAGPSLLTPQELGVYTATYTPVTATQPLITWDNGISGPTAGYFWDSPGTHAITATVANGCGQVSAVLSVTVCQVVESITISGATRPYVDQMETYTASVFPPNAAPTFVWSNGATGPTAAYSWTLPGTYTITVVASNACSGVQKTLEVQVRLYRQFLPIKCKPDCVHGSNGAGCAAEKTCRRTAPNTRLAHTRLDRPPEDGAEVSLYHAGRTS